MREALHLSVRPLPVNKDEASLSDILYNNEPVGLSVSGAVLEAAYEGDGFYLLFMTDDVPHEEGLTIHLVSPDFKDVETAALVGLYSSGAFRDAVVMGPRQIGFSFFGGAPVMLEVLKRPEFRVPLVPECPGSFRPFGFIRRFRMREMPRL
jgi:hypothetical protein